MRRRCKSELDDFPRRLEPTLLQCYCCCKGETHEPAHDSGTHGCSCLAVCSSSPTHEKYFLPLSRSTSSTFYAVLGAPGKQTSSMATKAVARKSAAAKGEAAGAVVQAGVPEDGPMLTPNCAYYLKCCKEYGVSPNASIEVALQNPWVRHLEVNYKEFTLKDMLALGEVLKINTHIETVNLAHCYMDSNCVYVLKNVLEVNRTIRKVDLSYNLITKYGAEALGDILRVNSTLTHLKMRGNHLDTKAALGLASGLQQNKTLQMLDVSNNSITIEGINRISTALANRQTTDLEKATFQLHIEGNFWAEELVNSITHGVGVLLSLIFGLMLTREAADDTVHPPAYFWSCVVFTLSLVAMYMCSTLAHSFHRMRITGNVFIILDHSCISVLIAGSYTPFCMVTLGHMWEGTVLCITLWVMAGIAVALSLAGPKYQKAELALFIIMGWMVILPMRQIIACLDTGGLVMLFIGGVWYTSGVYFFIRGTTEPIMHAIWHCFVLAGSICHYLVIYFYVRPCAWNTTVETYVGS